MVERRSALERFAHGLAPEGSADGTDDALQEGPRDAAVLVRDVLYGSIVQIGAWPDTLPRVAAVVRERLGFEPAPVGRFAEGRDACTATLSPGRFLVLAGEPALAARLEAALPSADGAVTDLTHGRVALRLEGACAADVLAKGCAIDFDLSAFPVGRAAQTLLGHIDALILRREDETFELVVLRGFAEALAEWLLDAGLEFGIAFSARAGEPSPPKGTGRRE